MVRVRVRVRVSHTRKNERRWRVMDGGWRKEIESLGLGLTFDGEKKD